MRMLKAGCLVALVLCALAPACKSRKKKEEADRGGGAEATATEEAPAACGAEDGTGAAPAGVDGPEPSACAAANVPEEGPVSDEDARHAMRLFRQYRTWERANAQPYQSVPHGLLLTDFVNNLARDAWLARRGYPVGAALAAEGWRKNERAMVWLMEKRPPGYDSEHGDWWYATVEPDGKVRNAGRVATCIDCHATAANDYVHGQPR